MPKKNIKNKATKEQKTEGLRQKEQEKKQREGLSSSNFDSAYDDGFPEEGVFKSSTEKSATGN